MKNDSKDIVNEMITRYLTGETTADQEKKLLGWIAEHPDNERLYLDFKKAFELSKAHYNPRAPEDLNIDLDLEWDQFIRNKKAEKTKNVSLPAPETTSRWQWLRVAAAMLLLLVAGAVINYFIGQSSQVILSTLEKRQEFTLPDGSQVTLNKYSELSYAKDFTNTSRMVNLKGEAFFQVESQTGSTFVITANDLEIAVLGTSFNVQAYDHSKEIEVVVQTGKVELAHETNQESITLQAGEKGIYRKVNKQLSREPNKDINFLSWKTRKITFMQDDLRTVAQTLNRTYQVNIYFSADIPPTCELTVTFDNQTLDAVLNVLKNTLDLSYQIDGDQIEITGAGC